MVDTQAIDQIAASIQAKKATTNAPTKAVVTPAIGTAPAQNAVDVAFGGTSPFSQLPKVNTARPFTNNKIADNSQQAGALINGASDLIENFFGAPAFLASGGNPITGKPLVPGGGSIPRGFSNQVTEAVRPGLKQVGLEKIAPAFGLAGGLMEPLGPLGEAGKGAEAFLKAAKAVNTASEAEKLMRGVGFAEDVVKQYAPSIAKETNPENIKTIVEAAAKLQNTTKIAPGAVKAASEASTATSDALKAFGTELKSSNVTKTQFLTTLGEKINAADESAKTAIQAIRDAGYTPSKFYDAVKSGEFLKSVEGAAAPPFPVPPATTPVDAAVNKLVDAIKAAKPIRRDVSAQQSAELARRAQKLEKIYSGGGGEQAYFDALKKLKGQLTEKGTFTAVRDQLTTDEVGALFDKINFAKQYNVFEKTSISDALQQILRGEVPQPKQLSNLEDLFGHDIVGAILKHTGSTLYRTAVDLLNIPRTLMTAFDMSAPFRQGIVASVRHPITATKAFNEMFRQAFSQKNFEKWLTDVKASPDYQVMKRSGLYIADPRDLAGGLNSREEGFISRLAEKVPGIRASQRAYLAFLNKLRVDIFRDMSKTFIAQGAGSPKDLESLAQLVNVSTGRGDLGRLGRIAPELNTVFFSPRLIAARLSLLNPVWYAKQTPMVRKEAMKTMLAFVGTGMGVLTMAKLGGADVEADPRSTDFGKIKVGNTRWDIWGGFQQWARVFAQVASGQRKTAAGQIQNLTGKEFPFQTRFDVALNFGTGKLAPIPALTIELLKGQQVLGGDLNLTDAAVQNTAPLYAQDIAAAIQDGGIGRGVAAGVPGFFGVGVQTYQPTPKKKNTGLKVNFGNSQGASTKKVKIKFGG